MLKFQNVTKIYNGIPVLDNVSLEFAQGKLYALIGPNGSGKTTMMKAAAGLVKPESGLILFNGVPINVKTRADIAYMPTEPYYYNFMSIRDVGKYHKDFFDDFDIDYYKKLLSYMELSEKLKVKSLSSGMNAKLKIAATLARRAKVIMLDEPLNGIDVIARDQIISSIIASASSQGSCFLISSHLFDELEPIVHDVVMVRNGRIIISGDINEIRQANNKSISDLYREIYGGMNFNPYANMQQGNMGVPYGQPVPMYPQYPQYPQQGMPQYPQYPQNPQYPQPMQNNQAYPQYPQYGQNVPQYPQYQQWPPQNQQQQAVQHPLPMPQNNIVSENFAANINSQNNAPLTETAVNDASIDRNINEFDSISGFEQISENAKVDEFFDISSNENTDEGGADNA
ncbi:MAG: ABC transporter ATP-binding protein [Oscillospiraceae bacterium]|nr:ABC transporter ATP-binding protein [Oscillospiraceae bacterium]